jgi:PAS domain S-box-containing protein
MNWKSIANYKILLPAWAIILIIVTIALATMTLSSWESVFYVTLVGTILSWVWLREGQETIEFLKPECQTPLTAVPNELRKTLTELKDALERYATVTQNLSGAVLVRDRDGAITYCNPYTERLFGVPRETIMGSPEDFVRNTIPEDDLATYTKAHMLSLVGEPFQYRHRFRHASGPEMWAETRIVPLLNAQGDVDATLSIMIDVTKSMRAEEETEKLNADLQDFYYMISHDLRTPLVTIKGGLGLLKPLIESKGEDQHKEMLQHMFHARDRLDTLINAVVDYGKISNQGFSPTAISPLPILKDVVRSYEIQIAERHGTLILPDCIPMIQASPVPLSQIFGNLIENALKYSHPDRAPLIKVSSQMLPGVLPEVLITIEDNGLGIPPDKIQNIFRPFQRGHPNVERGSGVGLASVKKLTEKLGGSIEVTSQEGVGTAFRLTFESGSLTT